MAVLIVVGLRRSGTTALWRSFQQLPGFVGLYEPFNPKLGRPLLSDRKKVWSDLRVVRERDPAAFASRFAPILPPDEASPQLTPESASYLRWLLDQTRSANVILSMTRCGFKLAELRKAVGPSAMLHISREPVSWIRAHLFPSERGWSYAQQRLRSRLPVFRDRTMPRDYALDVVVESPAFVALLREAGIPDRKFQSLTAAQRLYMLWLLHENRVESEGSATWGGSHKLISHPEFVRAPEQVLAQSLALADIEVDQAAIHDACAHVRAFDAFRSPSAVTRRIVSDVAGLNADPTIDTSLTTELAEAHGAPADAA